MKGTIKQNGKIVSKCFTLNFRNLAVNIKEQTNLFFYHRIASKQIVVLIKRDTRRLKSPKKLMMRRIGKAVVPNWIETLQNSTS